MKDYKPKRKKAPMWPPEDLCQDCKDGESQHELTMYGWICKGLRPTEQQGVSIPCPCTEWKPPVDTK